jgi:hypothetical protein
VKTGQHVWVTALDGAETKGVIGDITPATIEIKGEHSTKRFNVTDVRRIATRDSLKNGAIIGGCVLGGLGTLAALRPGTHLNLKPTGQKIVVVGLDVAAGAGIGALIDLAVKGRDTVYERPASAPSVRLTPIVAPHGFAVAGAIQW